MRYLSHFNVNVCTITKNNVWVILYYVFKSATFINQLNKISGILNFPPIVEGGGGWEPKIVTSVEIS